MASRSLQTSDTRPNGDALRKCILQGPYTPTTIIVPAVPATENSPVVPEQTTEMKYTQLLMHVRSSRNVGSHRKAKTRNNLTVATMQVNVQFLQPEWSRFVTIFKQQHKLDEVSYHKLFDILKQYQKEVNELRAERMAKNANPLALVATAHTLQDTYYQSSKPQKSYAPASKALLPTISHATTRYKGKEIAKPITPPSKSASKEDSDPEQAQRDKDMQKNLALIAKNKNVDTTPRYKNDNQIRQFGNQRAVNVAGARETVGGQVVQQSGIQCFNCKGFGHFVTTSKPEQSYCLADMDEEIDELRIEAHYSYNGKDPGGFLMQDSGTDSDH
ncbi:hypothetical protein Tco_0688779 [Tanacetum coccineum]